MSMLDQLMEMGFSLDLAKRSLEETNERGLEDALDWLESRGQIGGNERSMNNSKEVEKFVDHKSEFQDTSNLASIGDEKKKSAEDVSLNISSENGGKANEAIGETSKPKEITFKCNQCGKLLKGELEVTFHAGKTQHDVFSESVEQIKHLTKEEKEQKVLEMREKIKVAMAKKDEKEIQEAIEKEKKRRLDGQATAEMLERRRELEMKQLAEQRKREKQEEAEAKRRVLEQIQRDREARKAANELKPVAYTNPPKLASLKSTSTNAEHCNLQIRLPDGTTMKEKFKSTETLAAVRLWVELNRKDPDSYHYPFTLMVPFPRQVFTSDDMERPLKALGLVPSACLVVTRAQAS